MPSVAMRSLSLLALLSGLGSASGCSRGGDPLAWVSERSAVVRCTSSGKRPPAPAIAGVPAPLAPTGLFARQLDPLALDALGFARDGIVCATLEAPPPSSIDAAVELQSIVALHEETSRDALRAGGRCTCEVARAQGIRELIAACVQTPTVGGCDPTVNAEAVAAAVAPLVDALDDVALPWIHWRLVGATDRPGWFAANLLEALVNHDGGSIVHLPNTPIPPRTDPLVRAALGVDKVVAVVRQDGARAILIARELDGLLVLDHFRQPLAAPDRLPLVARVEAAQISTMIAQLAHGPTRKLLTSPADGTLVEFDRPLLEEIDRVADATGSLLGPLEEPTRQAAPPILFDRIAYVAPHGEAGAVLRIEHVLSVEGLAWAQTLTDLPLVGNLAELGLGRGTTPEKSAEASVIAGPWPDRFHLRGSTTERWGVAGVHRFATLANLLEIAAPGALAGDLSSWRIDWPGLALPAELAAAPFDGIRMLASTRPYRLQASFDNGRTRFVVEVRPR